MRSGAGPIGRALTAHALNSGCRESASTASFVNALTVSHCAVLVVPVERRETVSLTHPFGNRCGQHRASTARHELDGLAVDDAHGRRVGWVDLDERPVVEVVQPGHLAGLGHGVPLMLQPAGVEHQREVVVGQLARVHVRAGVERRSPGRRGERQHAIVDVPDRVARIAPGRAWPLDRRLSQSRIAHPAQVVTGLRVREAANLVENLFAGGEVEMLTEPHVRGDLADQLPVRTRMACGRDGSL